MAVIVPDYAEPFLAYRSWRAHSGGVQLISAFQSDPWPTTKSGGLEAKCHLSTPGYTWLDRFFERVAPPKPCATSPSSRCRSHHPCGIYAYRTLDGLRHSAISGPIWGEVLLGGEVMEHDYGYRAQFGTVHALYDHIPHHRRQDPETWLEQLARIADYYSVPLVHLEA